MKGDKRMKNDFGSILERRHNGSMKWETPYINKRFHTHFQAEDQFYPLFIADMDFKMDENVQKKLMQFVSEGDLGYFHVHNGMMKFIIFISTRIGLFHLLEQLHHYIY